MKLSHRVRGAKRRITIRALWKTRAKRNHKPHDRFSILLCVSAFCLKFRSQLVNGRLYFVQPLSEIIIAELSPYLLLQNKKVMKKCWNYVYMMKQNDQDDGSNLQLISVIWIVCGFVMVVGSTVILNRTLLQSYLARGIMIRLFCPCNGWRVDCRLVLHQVK